MSKHISNFSQGSDKIVLDLINEQNGLNLTEAQVDTLVIGEANTKAGQIQVIAKKGGGYRGSKALNYNRIMLGEMFNIFNPEGLSFELGDNSTVGQVIADINAIYGVNLTKKDIFIDGVSLADSADTPVMVEFDADTTLLLSADHMNPHVNEVTGVPQLGKVWTGIYELRLTKTTQALADIWGVTVLDGLYPPGAGSPGEWVEPEGDYVYYRTFEATQPETQGNYGQSLSVSNSVAAVSAQKGVPETEFAPGYVVIQHGNSVGQWRTHETITAVGDQYPGSGTPVASFGRTVAMSPNGLLMAVTTSQNTTGLDSEYQHSIKIYKRKPIVEGDPEYGSTPINQLVGKFALTAAIEPPNGGGEYHIGCETNTAMVFSDNGTLAFVLSNGVPSSDAVTNSKFFTYSIAEDGTVGSYKSISLPNMTTAYWWSKIEINPIIDNGFHVNYFNEGDDEFTDVQIVRVVDDGSVLLTSDPEGVATQASFVHRNGKLMILKNGDVVTSPGYGPWTFVQNLRDSLGEMAIRRFGVDFTVSENAKTIVMHGVVSAVGVSTDQSFIAIFYHDWSSDKYVLNAIMRVPREDETSDNPDVLHRVIVSPDAFIIFGSQLGTGEADPGKYNVGVVHSWNIPQIM